MPERDLDALTLVQVIAREDRDQLLCAQTAGVRDGVGALLPKRPPRCGDA